jgi:hypothetical protein
MTRLPTHTDILISIFEASIHKPKPQSPVQIKISKDSSESASDLSEESGKCKRLHTSPDSQIHLINPNLDRWNKTKQDPKHDPDLVT